MNIKDPEVRRLASELAERRHTSLTDAVRQALVETLDRDRADRRGVAEKLMEIGRSTAPYRHEFLTDDDLYDENGLPK